MSDALARWNRMPIPEAEQEILPCCGSRAWAQAIVSRRPINEEATLLAVSDEIWHSLKDADWMEAFRSHPRIGESRPENKNSATNAETRSRNWSAREQREIAGTKDSLRNALAEGNREYERRFGCTFIICASGKGAREILNVLRRRLQTIRQPSCWKPRSSSVRSPIFASKGGLLNERYLNPRA